MRPTRPGPKPRADSLTDAPVLAVKIPRALLRQVDARAKSDGQTRADAVREALRRYVAGDTDG